MPSSLSSDLTPALVEAARHDAHLRDVLHDLCMDAVEMLRAMIDSSSNDERLNAAKALAPIAKALFSADSDRAVESEEVAEGRAILAEMRDMMGSFR